MSKNCFLITSCDKYKNIIPLSLDNFFLNIETKYNVYVSTNFSKIKDSRIINLRSKSNLSWSNDLKIILEQIPEENIFVIVEDFIVNSKKNLKEMDYLFNLFISKKMNHLKYLSQPKADKKINNFYGLYEPGCPYRATVMGLWKKEILKKLLINMENPCEFEMNASYRSAQFPNFYGLYKDFILLVNLIEKGKINSIEKKKIKNLSNYKLELNNQNLFESLISIIKKIIVYFIFKISWKKRLGIVFFFKRLLQVY